MTLHDQILTVLEAEPWLTVRELAERLGRAPDSSHVRTAVDRLNRRGLLDRRQRAIGTTRPPIEWRRRDTVELTRAEWLAVHRAGLGDAYRRAAS